MVSRYYIRRNLKSLNQKYIRAKTLAEPLYFSKLAIIELCGWIETSLDEIYFSSLPHFVEEQRYIGKVEGRIKDTYGFNENKHLKPLLNILVGYHGVEKLEKSCNPNILGALYRNLNELTIMRNNLAHTYIKGFTTTIESPQLILGRLEQVADGLDHLEEKFIEFSIKLDRVS